MQSSDLIKMRKELFIKFMKLSIKFDQAKSNGSTQITIINPSYNHLILISSNTNLKASKSVYPSITHIHYGSYIQGISLLLK